MKNFLFGMALSVAALSVACGDSSATGGAGGVGTTSTTQASTTTATSSSKTSTTATSTTATNATSTTNGTSTTNATSTTDATSTTNVSSSAVTGSASSSSGGNNNVSEVNCQNLNISATITTTGLMFTPSTATITVGSVVQFIPGGAHTVTANDGSFFVDQSQTKCFAFNAVGDYPFHCSIHLGMTGTITVQ